MRLRLHYGSASIRVVNPEVAAAFELSTPQARVILQQPGRVRVDAERVRDTSSVNVFDGVAVVEGGGERLTVRAGRSAEMQGQDLRTTQAVPDAFDDWVAVRDRASDAVLATRYVPAEMTGYEDLDRYGSWQSSSEYGSLWLPAVASDWVPYRDGRWTWIAPRGWTWVDNAPTGLRALPLWPLGARQPALGLGAGPPRPPSGVGAGPWSAGWAAAAGT
ncbi:hypothetical protein G4G31_04135 [Massilia sp. Se16.2.3]|nr:DUF6600 domain-containing protein [Massilia sp. Se16.2.3]QNA98211.1 hypothetical protein G4G31_04135 [Massilia sp. Se16.2.3]